MMMSNIKEQICYPISKPNTLFANTVATQYQMNFELYIRHLLQVSKQKSLTPARKDLAWTELQSPSFVRDSNPDL